MPRIHHIGLAFTLACAATTAVGNVFLLIPGVPGESSDDRHRAWIDVRSLSIGVANGACSNAIVNKRFDSSSPVLSAAALIGSAYPSMSIEVTSPTDSRQTYLTYSLTNVTVAAVQASTSEGVLVSESVSLLPTTITISYLPQRPDGSFGTAISYTLACPKR